MMSDRKAAEKLFMVRQTPANPAAHWLLIA
jgi:hypothetical protein